MPLQESPQPFSNPRPRKCLEESHERLAFIRWPDEVDAAGWDYGTILGYLRRWLIIDKYFDWQAQEQLLNRPSHFRVRIEDLSIHFIHERGKGPETLPIILTQAGLIPSIASIR